MESTPNGSDPDWGSEVPLKDNGLSGAAKGLLKLDGWLFSAERILAMVFFGLLTVLVLLSIVSRNLFAAAFSWAPDIAQSLVLWVGLVGATMALKTRRHIRLSIFMQWVPPAGKFAADVAVSLFGAAVMGLLAWASVSFIRNEVAMFGGAGWFSSGFPLFFLVAAFRFLVRFFAAPLGIERLEPPKP